MNRPAKGVICVLSAEHYCVVKEDIKPSHIYSLYVYICNALFLSALTNGIQLISVICYIYIFLQPLMEETITTISTVLEGKSTTERILAPVLDSHCQT